MDDAGWSQEECIESLMRKSGYSGPLTAPMKQSLSITKYQSTKISLTYDQYLAGTATRDGPHPYTNGFALNGVA